MSCWVSDWSAYSAVMRFHVGISLFLRDTFADCFACASARVRAGVRAQTRVHQTKVSHKFVDTSKKITALKSRPDTRASDRFKRTEVVYHHNNTPPARRVTSGVDWEVACVLVSR